MNIHYLQHAEGEGPGQIAHWARRNGHALGATHWYRGDATPDTSAIDFLAIMGGVMNVYEYRNHPWLRDEKLLIERLIDEGKPILGICLGAQLLADVLGGKVYQNLEYEVGWFPVKFSQAARETPVLANAPDQLTTLHWHGDTFSLPPDCTRLASSQACENQAFLYGTNVVALQFHAEVTPEDVRAFVQSETGTLPQGRYVQAAEEILAGDHHIPPVHHLLESLLDQMTLR